jgi:hypothetical protein
MHMSAENVFQRHDQASRWWKTIPFSAPETLDDTADRLPQRVIDNPLAVPDQSANIKLVVENARTTPPVV